MEQQERFRGCLLGLAAGDAVGTTVEFRPRDSFEPVTDMVGGGPFHLQPGQWTDDTSMALCLGYSLVETGGFDADDQMQRYLRWWRDGYLSSTGTCFDIGNTIASALSRYQKTSDPYSGSTSTWSAGNGCIMRLAPVPMFYWRDQAKAIRYAAESSRTTHGTAECLDACRLFSSIIFKALAGLSKEVVLFDNGDLELPSDKIQAIADGSYRSKNREQIRGSGYVVESLEASLWCFLNTDTFKDAILTAVNLGDDADTTGAICGQVAGAFYGQDAIPAKWRKKLTLGQEIADLADQLFVTLG
jgi:ADP-ribosyl-[dinitrogen reductase] hydrolase